MRYVTIIAFLLLAPEAQAIDCASAPASRVHWSWRQIDGKRCWYQGSRRIAKGQLHWNTTSATDTLTDADRRITPELIRDWWEPPREQVETFDRRFDASFGR